VPLNDYLSHVKGISAISDKLIYPKGSNSGKVKISLLQAMEAHRVARG
jgi:hypothetical protein